MPLVEQVLNPIGELSATAEVRVRPPYGSCAMLVVNVVPRLNSVRNGGRRCLFFYIFIYYLPYVSEYTTIFRHTRRGDRTPLQMVVSHHVVTGS